MGGDARPDTSLMNARSWLPQILEAIRGLRIAVVGDFFLDKYLVIDPALSEPKSPSRPERRRIKSCRSAAARERPVRS